MKLHEKKTDSKIETSIACPYDGEDSFIGRRPKCSKWNSIIGQIQSEIVYFMCFRDFTVRTTSNHINDGFQLYHDAQNN